MHHWQTKKFPLKSFYKLAARLLLLFSAGKTTAQARKEIRTEETVTETTSQVYSTITGFVIDSTGEPLTGATIQLYGQAISLMAGIDGEFEMRIPDSAFATGTVSLTFSYVSYRSASIIFSREDFPLSIRVKLTPPSSNNTTGKSFEIMEESKETRIYTEQEIVKRFSDGGDFVLGKMSFPVSGNELRSQERELQYKQRENRLNEFIQDYGH